MTSRIKVLLSVAALSSLLAACADVTSPTNGARNIAATAPSFSGGVADTSLTPGGGGGGGGGGGSRVVDAPCGVLTTNVQTTQILVYTVRAGIGFSGQVTNCSLRTREAFDIAIVDQETDPACRVFVPHYVAARNTSAGATIPWSASSTLVPCQNRLHTFTVTLSDTQSGVSLATSTASFFL